MDHICHFFVSPRLVQILSKDFDSSHHCGIHPRVLNLFILSVYTKNHFSDAWFWDSLSDSFPIKKLLCGNIPWHLFVGSKEKSTYSFTAT